MAELILKSNNLYRNGIVIIDPLGDEILERNQIEVEETADNLYHIVTKTDRLDKLAYDFYHRIVEDSSKYWWVIADANNIENPLYLDEIVGKRIIIPDILKVLLQI